MRLCRGTYEFRDVENFLSEKHSHTKSGGPLELLIFIKVGVRCIGQELKTTLVVVFVIVFSTVVLGKDISEECVNLAVDVGHGLCLLSNFV
jgi:hypothetical protein